MSRLLGGSPAAPVLSPLASKFGGTPYRERDDGHAWDGWTFVCQVNLADLPPVPGAPGAGLFALDAGPGSACGFRVRTYAAPSDHGVEPLAPVPRAFGRWETRMHFERSWTLPDGRAWEAALDVDDPELTEMWLDWEPEGRSQDEVHRLFGHCSNNFEDEDVPAALMSREVALTDYELLFRMTYDNVADFGLGTNWVNVLIPAPGFARGSLDGAVVAVTNW